ncbi:bifunctional indole-3-glycerol-phosphate synthase TrpC/phosphoribosylanthranilate isomerase TrpF [Corynebacterium sp. p3-SID1194]|uniref:bifunctional indole-3-glycerol-phosphate synthase TrpC/phosphoribosylanthranilate isomerase TrpF n=1 Tax=Corynebacterium sp. p3-SID1194 TaxID=2916105 RepID=UPI0021A5B1AC|nr:bifunctional indole-3-glycerol-phosphate synthase TrpC/phosphoribosylanthranilate isomerase TrpF [Corynebacterium sp. p3-SID1194]MCT1450294.1 bifunctional indole-3-glycerol-phosphate synthase TrpC/phosphoribosylanthranilate isomerase TrpF [Corynebacterium sp. p3-SID1194]
MADKQASDQRLSDTAPSAGLPTVLEDIVTARKRHIDEIKARISHVNPASLPRSERSLYDSLARPGTRFIMECKSSSPSLGMIREHYEPGEIASIYSRYAAGISVLCEPERFGGDYDHLATVAATTHLPVLCKDFIVDPVQIHAARYFGADAILLMLSVLDDDEYASLSAEADRLGLDVLTEVIDEDEAARATKLGAKIFGINHRNLHDLTIDLERSARLAPLAPEGALIVSESGIRDVETVRRLGGHSDGFLVGSHLTGTPDIDWAARMLVYGPNKVCGLTSHTAAQTARAAGAVYGGLIFEENSPRNVSRETAKNIIAHEPGLHYVSVSRRTDGWDELVFPGIRAVQIHSPFQGSLDAEHDLIAKIRDSVRALDPDIEIWRAVSMSDPDGPAVAKGLAADVDKLVLDAKDGGSGTGFDWSTIPDDVRGHSLLAGGLGPKNVDEALNVGCLGLDLNSGVEYPAGAGIWAGAKDAGALRVTFDRIRNFHY